MHSHDTGGIVGHFTGKYMYRFANYYCNNSNLLNFFFFKRAQNNPIYIHAVMECGHLV